MAAGAVEANITTNDSKVGAYFDGVDDYLDAGAAIPSDLTGDITISAWINAKGFGEGGAGMIINNGQLFFYTRNNTIRATSNALTNADSAVGAFDATLFNTWMHLTLTRNAAGDKTNFYINGVASGAANQYSGTPVAGSTNTFIGNRLATDRSYFGALTQIKIWDKILTSSEITQNYTGQSVPLGLIYHLSLQKDYIDKCGTTATNSGTHFANVDDAVAAAMKADWTTANDHHMVTNGAGGQIYSAVIEEAP